MAKIALFITAKAQPGKREELRKLFEKHIKPHAEANQLEESCVYCYANEDEDTICMFEMFSEPSVVKEDMESEWFGAYQKEASSVLAGPPQVVMATPVWAKGTSV
jgi:quinol monooxygenase YgiN